MDWLYETGMKFHRGGDLGRCREVIIPPGKSTDVRFVFNMLVEITGLTP